MVLVKGSDMNLTTLLELKSKFSYTPIAEQNFNCFYIVKICEAWWNGCNINSNKFMFFFRVPKCVKLVILWMWIWLKDCQGEQSSLSFMKKTSQTDEESFSNYGSGSKYLEKEIVPFTFMSMRWYLWNWSMGPPLSSRVYWIYFNSFSFFFFFFFLTDFVVVVPE